MPRPLTAEPRRVHSLRLTAREAAAIAKAASAQGLSVSDWMRAQLMQGSRGKRGRRAGWERAGQGRTGDGVALVYGGELDGARRLALELSRQGNNLNQIAHALNRYETPDMGRLKRLVADTRAMLLMPVLADLRTCLNRIAGFTGP